MLGIVAGGEDEFAIGGHWWNATLPPWNSDQRLSAFWGRRSIRAYTDRPVSDEIIVDLLRAAMAAPSAAAFDPWRLMVVQETEILQRMAAALRHGRMLAGAPAGFVVCGDLAAAHRRPLRSLLHARPPSRTSCWPPTCWGRGRAGSHCIHGEGAHRRRCAYCSESLHRSSPVSAVAMGYPARNKRHRARATSRLRVPVATRWWRGAGSRRAATLQQAVNDLPVGPSLADGPWRARSSDKRQHVHSVA